MSVTTDLDHQVQATVLAFDAVAWLRRNHSIRAMNDGNEMIVFHDFGLGCDRVWYTQAITGEHIKFGHVVMRPNCLRYAFAAASDFLMHDGLHWVMCGVSDHPSNADITLAAHVHEDNMVHEATHCIDFRRSKYKPQGFRAENMYALHRHYNSPHERNAYFHQGLYSFLGDLNMVMFNLSCLSIHDRSGRHCYLLRILMDGSYWPCNFVRGLTRRNRQRLLRRAFRLFAVLLPSEQQYVASNMHDPAVLNSATRPSISDVAKAPIGSEHLFVE